MNLYVRLFFTLLKSLIQPPIRTAEATVHWFRVWPTDIDLYGHMNNGRYFQIMDVARFGWLIRTGTVKVLSANKWSAFLGGGQMRFRKALKLLERFSVTTRLLSWDENWYFLEHRFHNAGGKLVAMGVVRAAFRGGKGWVKTSLSMPLIDGDRQPPPLGEGIQRWLDAEELLVRQPGD